MNSGELYTINRGDSLKYLNFKCRLGAHMNNHVGLLLHLLHRVHKHNHVKAAIQYIAEKV
jgi:hypothetical protein